MNTTGTGLVRYLRTLAAAQADNPCTDQQLLQQFVTRREQAAFAALVRRHGPMVLGVCRRVLGHDQDAEDAFQATFLVLARKAGSIRKHESLSSWLHGVAYHIAEKLRAKEARRVVHERKAASRLPVDPAEEVAWSEIRCLLDSELARLPERYRGPLVLCYLQGKTQDEAARQLEWSLSTLRRRLDRARQVLACRLTRRGLSLSAALTAPVLIENTATAALPPLLAASTIRAALAAAMGNTISDMVSAQVVALAEGGIGSLLVKKASIAVMLLVSLTLGVGGLLAHRAVQDRTFAEAPAAPPGSAPQSSPARSASKDQAIEIKGRVLDPDGKPLAGAKVYVSPPRYKYEDKSDPKMRAKSDGDGRFRFQASRMEVDREEMLAAVAPDYGLNWVSLREVRKGKELTLRLVKDDVPIKGRVLDLEGRPIAGATVRLMLVRKTPDENLTPYLKELQTKSKERNALGKIWVRYQRIMTEVWGIPVSVKTAADGRFELRGFGRDRIAFLRIEGPDIEYRIVMVITRPDVPKELPPNVHGAKFDYTAAPGKRIHGTVREKGSGKPVSGARIHCVPSARQYAVSDKEGHYAIPGIGKSEQYHLSVQEHHVSAGSAPIIACGKQVADTPGLQPITEDFEVERGLLVQVRVTEKGTGKAVTGKVWYSPAADNPNLKNYTTRQQNVLNWPNTEKDGTFNQVVLPGPGVIAIWADENRFIRPHIEGQNIRVADSIAPLNVSHAVVSINPSDDDPKSLVCDIVLDPGRDVSGMVVGPDDRPLTGVKAEGLVSVIPLNSEPELPDNRFTVRGLEPGKPRTVVFWHESKKLARAVVVRAKEKAPLTVRLELRGEVAGQLVDAKGRPLQGMAVIPRLSDEQTASLAYFRSGKNFGRSSLPKAVLPAPVSTDAEGRFRIKGFVSGLNYSLVFRENREDIAQKEISIKPGTTLDVGEIKTEAIPQKGAKEKP